MYASRVSANHPDMNKAILVGAENEKERFTRSEESRSAFVTLDAIFLDCRNVVRVCIGWPCNYHICVLPDYSISGESSPDRVSVQKKRHMSLTPQSFKVTNRRRFLISP